MCVCVCVCVCARSWLKWQQNGVNVNRLKAQFREGICEMISSSSSIYLFYFLVPSSLSWPHSHSGSILSLGLPEVTRQSKRRVQSGNVPSVTFDFSLGEISVTCFSLFLWFGMKAINCSTTLAAAFVEDSVEMWEKWATISDILVMSRSSFNILPSVCSHSKPTKHCVGIDMILGNLVHSKLYK